MGTITIKNLYKKTTLITLFKIFILPVLFIGIMTIISLLAGIKFGDLSRDPVQVLDGKPYVGFISSVGIIIWCASSSILFFSYILSKRINRPKKISDFLFYSALLTLWLTIDDTFMIHDTFVDYYLPQFVEKLLYICYASAVVSILYFYRDIAFKTDYVLFILAFGLLGSSILVDFIVAIHPIPNTIVLEDGFKFLGIVSWFAYYAMTIKRLVLSEIQGI